MGLSLSSGRVRCVFGRNCNNHSAAHLFLAIILRLGGLPELQPAFYLELVASGLEKARQQVEQAGQKKRTKNEKGYLAIIIH